MNSSGFKFFFVDEDMRQKVTVIYNGNVALTPNMHKIKKNTFQALFYKSS